MSRGRVGILTLALLTLACAPADAGEGLGDLGDLGAEPAPEWLVADTLDYALVVDWSGAERVGDEWVFTTALGFTVGVGRWSQALTNLELVPCDLDELGASQASFRHLGHEHDSSQLELQLAEELTEETTRWLGPAQGSGEPYCGVYEILGTVAFEPGGEELVTHIEGWWRAPGSTVQVPFVAINAVPVSALPRVGEGRYDDDVPLGGARVELRRLPARAFDDVDFEALSELEIAYEAAQAVTSGASISWAVAP